MDKIFLKNHFYTNENFDFLNDVIMKDYFITYSQIENTLKNTSEEESKKLYFNSCNYNQMAILQEFLKLLFEKFGDRFLISSKYKSVYYIYTRNENDKRNPLKVFSSDYIYTFFIIENYIYYIQFDKNPFFDSYISTKKIYKFDNEVMYSDLKEKFFTLEYYGGAKENKNINDFFEVFDPNLDILGSAKTLYNYFIEKCYKNESMRYISKNDERIFILNNEKNKKYSYNITGIGKIENYLKFLE